MSEVNKMSEPGFKKYDSRGQVILANYDIITINDEYRDRINAVIELTIQKQAKK